MIKYIVRPGTVQSRYDGQWHFISGPRLMALYKVSPKECLVDLPHNPIARMGLQGEFIELKPRFEGDYDIEKCERLKFGGPNG